MTLSDVTAWLIRNAVALVALAGVYLIFKWWQATGRLQRGE